MPSDFFFFFFLLLRYSLRAEREREREREKYDKYVFVDFLTFMSLAG